MEKTKILIFIVAYNAENHICDVLDRIPDDVKYCKKGETTILIIDDASKDNTMREAYKYKIEKNLENLIIFHNPVNQGYGGNQKIGYHYAIRNEYDVVVLLHGDGQYAPELLEEMYDPILKGDSDIVFGSRMLNPKGALMGGMPFYKFVGNRILTGVQNITLGARLSEFHSGYRAYRVKSLAKLPISFNSDGFDFDTDIIIQSIDNDLEIKEIPIPTHYGDEKCNVNGLKYAFNIILSTICSRLQKFNIYYTPKFDYCADNSGYESKFGFDSSHTFAVERVKEDSTVLDIGAGQGYIAEALKKKGCKVYGVDQFSPQKIDMFQGFQSLDIGEKANSIDFQDNKLDSVLLLDIIEHLPDPEKFLVILREKFAKYSPDFIITTGNIAFIMVRLSLLFGQFNYGKKGILDKTHKRLFTFKHMFNTLKDSGYYIKEVKGIPIPFPLIIKNKILAGLFVAINKALIRLSKTLFSYQIAIEASAYLTVSDLLKNAEQKGKEIEKEVREAYIEE